MPAACRDGHLNAGLLCCGTRIAGAPLPSAALTPAAPFRGCRPAQPTEYYQFDLDALDQNKPKNRAGGLLGKLKPAPVEVKEDALVVRAPACLNTRCVRGAARCTVAPRS